MPITFQVGKLSDKTIIETIEAIEARFGVISKSFQSAEIQFGSNLSVLKDKSAPTYLLTNANIQVKDKMFNIAFQRDYGQPNSVYFDLITITPRNNPAPTGAELVDLEAVIREKIRMPSLNVPINNEMSVSGLLEKEMATVASMHEKLMFDALELRKTYEQQDVQRKEQFELERREVERNQKENEQASLARIAVEREALEEKLKEFDFSDHMRARRKLRDDISQQVQEFLKSPQVPVGSSIKFQLVLLFSLAAAVLSAIFAYQSFESFIAENNKDAILEAQLNDAQLKSGTAGALNVTGGMGISPSLSPQLSGSNLAESQSSASASSLKTGGPYLLWLLALRAALLSAVTIGFIIYLISTLRKSYDEEVRSHRELQRYGMDINRASWVIETAMEMTTKEGAALPDKWVEGAVRGLFQPSTSNDGEVTSLAALGSLMGLAPNVTISPSGTVIEFPPKATKKASKDEA
ncbi:hypothetical protein GR212_15700 [Rhizobium lusitanum]|uniref:Uncharacterized protein n=1 Tax=Rhizobium lusitanum TaxID=293958 RepID=A0A6L9U520_9HYPH|nr:hypothetical protein [Rhizobium lusitanum]NEI71023.1 hypothetical protein [Rhizobium lusitanum]